LTLFSTSSDTGGESFVTVLAEAAGVHG